MVFTNVGISYSALATLLSVSLTPAIYSKSITINTVYQLVTTLTSKGGRPVSKVYNMQPSDHTSDSNPCAFLVAISLYSTK